MSYGRCSESAKFLLCRTKYRPSLAIICGTGLGSLGDLLSDTEVVSYADIPHFPISTGHNHRKYTFVVNFSLLLFCSEPVLTKSPTSCCKGLSGSGCPKSQLGFKTVESSKLTNLPQVPDVVRKAEAPG